MVSDEEILERAFLSALQKHFKKPGPWLPLETVNSIPVTTGWKCPQGQVWEVYVCNPNGVGGFLINGKACTPSVTIDEWYPQSARTVYAATTVGEIGTPGVADTSLTTDNLDEMGSMASEGWILSENDVIANTIHAFLIRKRRRFDLET